MTDRRYDDDEVAEILARATREGSTPAAGPPPPSEGLTLEELERIGTDVGIAPGRIAEAAHALERRKGAPAPQTVLGTPRSVTRTVPLARALDDEEWERLVADLRATFDAVGDVTTHGSLRTWANGNLQAHVEPHGKGWRLRMQTLKGDAVSLAGMGAVFALVGALLVVVTMIDDFAVRELAVAVAFTAVGLGHLVYLRWSLPRWADERAAQMDAIAARIPEPLRPKGP